jgi:hypothetical protein
VFFLGFVRHFQQKISFLLAAIFIFFLVFCMVLFGIYLQQWISVANGDTFSVVPINLGQMVHSRQFSMQFCAPMVRSLCYRNTLGQ